MLEYDRINISEGIDISKDYTINIMNNSSLNENIGVLYFFLFTHKKWVTWLVIKKQRGGTKWSKRLLWKQKKLREQEKDKYRNLSEKDKNKKREYVKKTDITMSEEKK